MTTRSSGFTLIELLVVVAILGIISAIGIVSYNGYVSSAKKKSAENIILQISLAQSEYYSDEDRYFTPGCGPNNSTSTTLETKLLGGYDVITPEIGYEFCSQGSAETYTIIAQETGASSPCKLEYTDKSVWTRTNC